METEELFIGGYIIRRDDEENFEIENTLDEYEEICIVSESRLTEVLDNIWKEHIK